MKYLSGTGLVLFSLSLAFQVNAQPPQPQNPTNIATQRYVEPPEGAVRRLVYAFNREGDMKGRASRVVGADPNDPALTAVGAEIKRSRGTFLLSVSDFKEQVNGKEATVTFRTTLQDNLLNQITQTETLHLQQAETEWEIYWKVVPAQPKELADIQNGGILLRLANFMAYPQQMLDLSNEATSRTNIQQLALGLHGLLQDYDERFGIKAETFQKTLASYVQSEQLFYAPADKSGNISYAFNPHLSGKSSHVAKPHQTIMIYEGANQQLSFRYANHALVAFVDGSTKLVTPEEAKELIWEP